jgi:uncharacterized integral membrane protein
MKTYFIIVAAIMFLFIVIPAAGYGLATLFKSKYWPNDAMIVVAIAFLILGFMFLVGWHVGNVAELKRLHYSGIIKN